MNLIFGRKGHLQHIHSLPKLLKESRNFPSKHVHYSILNLSKICFPRDKIISATALKSIEQCIYTRSYSKTVSHEGTSTLYITSINLYNFVLYIDKNSYSHTLQLPITSFSLRANASQREKQFRKKISEDTYQWQLANNKGEYYILHDGPPYANGELHLDSGYEIRELEVFKELLKIGYITRKNSPVHWSPSSKTALAESELEYKDDYISKSVYVKFEADKKLNLKINIDQDEKLYYLIWTTTSWTLPANKAIAVNPTLEYTLISKNSHGLKEHYIVASELANQILEILGDDYSIMTSMKILGNDLVGQEYKHYFSTESHPVLAADYVVSDSGTGLVHTAPGHGKDDFELCSAQKILPYSPVDDLGRFTQEAGSELVGKFVLSDGAEKVVQILKERDLIVFEKDYLHSYPIDWRTKKPIITRSTPQWFIDISELQNITLENIKSVKMYPESSKRRLEAFVKSRTRWCISRQRPWGTPIPVLYETETDEPLCTQSSVEHIIKKFKESNGSNAWWELSSEDLLADEYKNNGKKYYKKYDTMDVWFDSGTSWTLFREKLNTDKFVADLYLEGSDQHRGWFQSSILTSSAIQKVAPYKNLFTHGFLLDENGYKMSKSIGNTILPSTIIKGSNDKNQAQQAYGVDVLRLWVGLHDSSADIQIGPNVIANVSQTMRKLRGSFRFLLGNLNGFNAESLVSYDSLQYIDKYVLYELYSVMKRIEISFENHVFYQGMQSLVQFVNSTLSSLYFDSIKDRLYADQITSLSRLSAQTTCHYILVNMLTALSPITPHFTQEVFEFYKENRKIYNNLFSVFQLDYGCVAEEWNNSEISKEWDFIKKVKTTANHSIETLRQKKIIGGSVEASVKIYVDFNGEFYNILKSNENQLENALIVSGVSICDIESFTSDNLENEQVSYSSLADVVNTEDFKGKCIIVASKSKKHKCPRCWKHVCVSENSLCVRCSDAVSSLDS
ncbi:hypothetical protein BB561_002901 [Smittium simulii]|uniref:isoleucine--tRNA ligase n=1 Tax=Smittium simulii TaxID=133385 RepID=A0A2T9YNQ0_9FUNG|nr:hypothetical protein BB561_002901 [Smittium simulii]